jgi:hypothetical protein
MNADKHGSRQFREDRLARFQFMLLIRGHSRESPVHDFLFQVVEVKDRLR